MSERDRILRLLEEGKITPEEAVRLLEALGRATAPQQALVHAIKKISQLFQNAVRHLPELFREVTENPLETEIEEFLELPEGRPLQVDHVGGDLKVVFEKRIKKARIRARGYYRFDGATAELISEESELRVPTHADLHLEAAGGDLILEGASQGKVFVRFAGGDCCVGLREIRSLQIQGEAGDVEIRLSPTQVQKVRMNLKVLDGDLLSDLDLQEVEEGVWQWVPKRATGTIEVLVVLGDLRIRSEKARRKREKPKT